MKVEDVEEDNNHTNGHLKQEKKELELKDKDDMKEKEDEGKEKAAAAKTESVGLFELFKFADKFDVFLILLGLASAIACVA